VLSPTHMRLGIMVLGFAVAGLTGCRGSISREPPIHLNPNMDTQDKYKSYRKSAFFKDGRTMRTPPVGTVARGKLRADNALWRGKSADGSFIDKIPFTLTMKDLERGRDRYNIYCTPCHDKAGYGEGRVALRSKGMMNPPSFHQPHMGTMPLGKIFDTITNGSVSKLMPSYRHQITNPNDRWAVVAYVRALQRSQSADRGLVPTGERSAVDAEYNQRQKK
jgi:hypothetical protein